MTQQRSWQEGGDGPTRGGAVSRTAPELQHPSTYRVAVAVLNDLLEADTCTLRTATAEAYASDTAAIGRSMPGTEILNHIGDSWYLLRRADATGPDRLSITTAEEVISALRDDLADRQVPSSYADARLDDHLIASSYTSTVSEWMAAAGAAWRAALVDDARADASD